MHTRKRLQFRNTYSSMPKVEGALTVRVSSNADGKTIHCLKKRASGLNLVNRTKEIYVVCAAFFVMCCEASTRSSFPI